MSTLLKLDENWENDKCFQIYIGFNHTQKTIVYALTTTTDTTTYTNTTTNINTTPDTTTNTTTTTTDTTTTIDTTTNTTTLHNKRGNLLS